MTDHDPALRGSTLDALKLSCPSADFLASMDNPFGDADAEWSDEEQQVLIPRLKVRRKTYPPPPQVTVARPPPPIVEADTPLSSSQSSSPDRFDRLAPTASPQLPPKSPSRPDVRVGSSQEDLVQRFYQVTRERDALRKELQRRSMGPHGVPARASVVYKSEEKMLIEELQALRQEIRSWTEDFFAGPLSTSSRSTRPHIKSAASLFSSLTDNGKAYLGHARDRPLLVQAYIWAQLQKRIFTTLQRGCGYIWAGKLGDRKLRPINDTLRKAVKNEQQAEEYHRWRALTVNLLVPQVDGRWSPTFDAAPVLEWIRRFSSRLRRRLRPWATHSLRQGKEQLYTIISAAVALDLKMKRQRADYRFVTFTGGRRDQFWGYLYYDSEMEDIDEPEQGKARRVELSIAPALERCGNANGHVFDQNFILVKADVSTKRLDKKTLRSTPAKVQKSGMRKALDRWRT